MREKNLIHTQTHNSSMPFGMLYDFNYKWKKKRLLCSKLWIASIDMSIYTILTKWLSIGRNTCKRNNWNGNRKRNRNRCNRTEFALKCDAFLRKTIKTFAEVKEKITIITWVWIHIQMIWMMMLMLTKSQLHIQNDYQRGYKRKKLNVFHVMP